MNIKKVLLLLFILIPLSCYAIDYPKISSQIIEIYDMDDEKVLYEVKSTAVVPIASLTKIATAITALEIISNIDEQVIITKNILNTVNNSLHVVGLKANDKVSYRDLLYACIVSSGADASNAIAILSSGSISSFVEKMNDLSKRIGLSHTHFQNVTGLDDKDNYSTADDIRKLLLYALDNIVFKEIFTTKSYQLSNGLNIYSTISLYDQNGALNTSFIKGSKTGYTSKAGYCLAYLMDVNGHLMLVITLNAPRQGNLYFNIIDASNISRFMLNNYREEILVPEKQLIREIPVELGNIEKYNIYASSNVTKYLPVDYDIGKLKIEYDGLKILSYNNHKDDIIGKVSYYFDNELLLEQNIILDQEIKLNIIKFLKKYYIYVIVLSLLIFLMFILLVFRALFLKKIYLKEINN